MAVQQPWLRDAGYSHSQGQLKALGTLSKMELVERRDRDDERIYGYQMTYQSGRRLFRLTLNKENQIAAMTFADDF